VPYCPNCQLEVAADASRCTRCNAVFSADGWHPVEGRAAPGIGDGSKNRILFGIINFFLAGASLFLLGLAYVLAERPRGSFPWKFTAAALMVLVVVIAVRARARWMFLVLMGSFAFFFSSCVANFHWG
jgi:O-antigen ligase